MTHAGYSKRSLADKLGLKPGQTVCILNAPNDYEKTLGKLPYGITQIKQLIGPLNLIQCFVHNQTALETSFAGLKKALAQDGMLWICWPKGGSKVETDLNENSIRHIALENGLVDVKVIAVDKTWSGLKLVYRLKDRK